MTRFRLPTILLMLICAFEPPAASARTKIVVPVVFFGDSIGAGYGLFDPKDALPLVLEREIRSDYVSFVMTNKSVAGDTTASALTRLKDVVAAKPKIVIIELGGNDALRGIDPDIVYNNLEIVLQEMARNGIYVLLVGMKAPASLGYEYRAQFDRIYPVLAERANVNFYPFLLEGVVGSRLYLQRDGIHPSKEGVQYIAEKMGPYLQKMVLHVIYFKKRQQQRLLEKQMKTHNGRRPMPVEPDGAYTPSESGAAPLPGEGN